MYLGKDFKMRTASGWSDKQRLGTMFEEFPFHKIDLEEGIADINWVDAQVIENPRQGSV